MGEGGGRKGGGEGGGRKGGGEGGGARGQGGGGGGGGACIFYIISHLFAVCSAPASHGLVQSAVLLVHPQGNVLSVLP